MAWKGDPAHEGSGLAAEPPAALHGRSLSGPCLRGSPKLQSAGRANMARLFCRGVPALWHLASRTVSVSSLPNSCACPGHAGWVIADYSMRSSGPKRWGAKLTRSGCATGLEGARGENCAGFQWIIALEPNHRRPIAEPSLAETETMTRLPPHEANLGSRQFRRSRKHPFLGAPFALQG